MILYYKAAVCSNHRLAVRQGAIASRRPGTTIKKGDVTNRMIQILFFSANILTQFWERTYACLRFLLLDYEIPTFTDLHSPLMGRGRGYTHIINIPSPSTLYLRSL